MKLIDKDAEVAEIEARYNECLKRAKIIDAKYWNGKADAYRDMLVILDALEVKEVDLEKELKNLIGNVGQCDRKLAKHFFELGLRYGSPYVSTPSIDDTLKEMGVDPDSKEASSFKESYYKVLDKLKGKPKSI